MPFDPERLTEIVCESESAAALDPRNEDHPTFWLVLADRFARRGIASSRARRHRARVLEVGDAFIYPTCEGHCWNLYTIRPDQLKLYGPRGESRGSRMAGARWSSSSEAVRSTCLPGTVQLSSPSTEWRPRRPASTGSRRGTGDSNCLGPVHDRIFRRMRLQKVGAFPIDAAALLTLFPDLRPGVSAAVGDISIASRMKIWTVPADRRLSAFTLHQLGTR